MTATAPANAVARVRRAAVVPRSSQVSAPAASRKPVSASRNDKPAIPTYATAGATGVSIAAKPTRPHGMPLNGQTLRTLSTTVQVAASQTGQAGNRRASGAVSPTRP
jgi:hypothetical protein